MHTHRHKMEKRIELVVTLYVYAHMRKEITFGVDYMSHE